jgi:hypothetical protein
MTLERSRNFGRNLWEALTMEDYVIYKGVEVYQVHCNLWVYINSYWASGYRSCPSTVSQWVMELTTFCSGENTRWLFASDSRNTEFRCLRELRLDSVRISSSLFWPSPAEPTDTMCDPHWPKLEVLDIRAMPPYRADGTLLTYLTVRSWLCTKYK